MDNATPSGNSVAAFALQKLATLTGNEGYQRHAVTVLRLAADQMRRHPTAFGWMLCALDFYLSKPKEIALVANGLSDSLSELLSVVWRTYLPNRIIVCATENHELAAAQVPLLANRPPQSNPQAFVCEAYACLKPTTDAKELGAQLTG